MHRQGSWCNALSALATVQLCVAKPHHYPAPVRRISALQARSMAMKLQMRGVPPGMTVARSREVDIAQTQRQCASVILNVLRKLGLQRRRSPGTCTHRALRAEHD